MDNLTNLYRDHRFAVYRRCRQLLHEDGDAEEITQEVFVRVLEKPHAFAGRAKASTYLYAIATHLCLNRLRHGALRGAAWREGVRQQDAQRQAASSPEAHVVGSDLVAAILAETDPATATIALYHYVDGLPQGEVATLVGLSRTTVNQRLARFTAQARLKIGEVA